MRFISNIVGPATVMAAGTMGAGAVATLVLSGAWFGYSLIWVILLMLPLFVISVDSASRVGALNKGIGTLSLIRQHIHPTLAWLILLINVPVHIFIIMGQYSVLTSSLESAITQINGDYIGLGKPGLIVLSGCCSLLIMWLVLSGGYQRMQKAMTYLLVAMFLCFFTVAIRSLSEFGIIFSSFWPTIPAELPVPGSTNVRDPLASMIAIIGSALAPAAILGIGYLTSDAGNNESTLKSSFHNSIINLGMIFGSYAMFVLIAGAFSLHSLPNFAAIESVQQAGQVLERAFPANFAGVGPFIFSTGLMVAALTTAIVAAQVSAYFCLDMLGKRWNFSNDNRLFLIVLALFTVVPALLSPLWEFPALLKVLLLMGINVVVIPAVLMALIYLVNAKAVVGQHTAEWWRNLILMATLVVSIIFAIIKAPSLVTAILS